MALPSNDKRQRKPYQSFSLPSVTFIIPKRPHDNIDDVVEAADLAASDLGIQYEFLLSVGNHPTYQRNACIELAKMEYLYFLDDDSLLDAHSLKIALEYIRTQSEQGTSVAILGGPSILRPHSTPFNKSIGAVLSSPLIVGSISARYYSGGAIRLGDEQQLILCNLLIRLATLNQHGNFREKLYPGEEVDIIVRLSRAGELVHYHPKVVVSRPHRPSYKDFLIQMFRYGRGRVELTKINIYNFRLAFFLYISAFLVTVFLAGVGLFFLPLSLVFPIAGMLFSLYLVYLLFAFFEARIRLSRMDIIVAGHSAKSDETMEWGKVFCHFFPLAFICHFFYALGMSVGLTKRGLKADNQTIAFSIYRLSRPLGKLRGKKRFKKSDLKKALDRAIFKFPQKSQLTEVNR